MRTLKTLFLGAVLFLIPSCASRQRYQVHLNPVDLSTKHPGEFNYQSWPQRGSVNENATGVALVVKNIHQPTYFPNDLIGLKGEVYGNLKNKDFVEQVTVVFDEDGKTNLLLVLYQAFGFDQMIHFYYWKKSQWIQAPWEVSQYGFSKTLSDYLSDQTGRLLIFK